MTAEQVLNHMLPALAGVKPRVNIKVQDRDLMKAELSDKSRSHPVARKTAHREERARA